MRRNGFTTVIALVVLTLISATLCTIAIGLHVEVTRTQLGQVRAELRQLQLAAARDTVERSRHWPPTIQPADWSIDLPPEFSNHASATAHLSGSNDALILLKSTIDKHQLAQQLHFHREQQNWKFVDAKIIE